MRDRLKEWSHNALIELVLVIVITCVFGYVLVANDVFEKWYHFTRQNEHLELDEIFSVALILMFVGSIFAVRHIIQLRCVMRELSEASAIIYKQAEIRGRHDKLAAMGELSGGLAHEINNALQPAIGLGGFIKEALTHTGNVRHVAYMETIMSSVQHAQHVIENVLIFTQDRSPDLMPMPAAEALRHAVQFAIDLLPTTVVFEVSGFPLPDEKAGARAVILANKTSLCQIALNISKNAMKAMNGAGKIRIDYYENALMPNDRATGAVRLNIQDEGCGIDDVHLARIFDPFFTTRDISEGTGLGLSVVNSLVQQHNGHISVYSAKGKGATFSLHFPKNYQQTED